MTPKEVLALCREKDVKAVDMRFMDFPGLWQHFTIPVDKLDEDVFEDGLGFDGSSIRGWQAINESDMLIVPQPDTAMLDPFCKMPTLSMICNIQDPITREDYTRDPRNVARKSVNYLKSTGIGDTCFIGPEAEFFIFDDVRFDQTPNSGYYFLDSIEGRVEPRPRREAEPRLQAAVQGRLLPRSARRSDDGHPQRDDADDDRVRHERRGPASRSGHRRPVGNRPEVRHAGDDGRQVHDVQVHHQERGQEVRQDGHVHAQAALRRQRLGHAHAHFALEGRPTAVRRQRLRGPERHGDLRHRRHPEARPGAVRHLQSDHQQLQAAGARLRGAGQSGLLAAEPLGGRPHSRCTARTRRPSGSSSAAPIRAAIRISRSRPC